MKYLIILLCLSTGSAAFAAKICQTQYTLLHYAETECHKIKRPFKDASFSISSLLIKANHPEPGTRPYMVIIPGGPGESSIGLRALLQQKEILNAFYHHLKLNVILIDPRGTGDSELPNQKGLTYTENNLSFKLLVEDFEAVLKYYNKEQYILLSHSMGSFTALKYAERNPKKVSKLVLIAPSSGIENLRQINLWHFTREMSLIQKHIALVEDQDYARRLKTAFDYVNDISIQQLKAHILNHYALPDFKGISTELFRKEIFTRIQNINTPSYGLLSFLEDVAADFSNIGNTSYLVPLKLRELQITPQDVVYDTSLPWRNIANHLICNEALTKKDMLRPLAYDGLSYQFRCPKNSKHFKSIGDLNPKKVPHPVLIVSGSNDKQVPYFTQVELSKSLINSELLTIEDGGHFPPNKDAMKFYNRFEAYLSDLL